MLPDSLSPNHALKYSGNDPAGVCNVESIQEDSLLPLDYLCPTGHHFLRSHRST